MGLIVIFDLLYVLKNRVVQNGLGPQIGQRSADQTNRGPWTTLLN